MHFFFLGGGRGSGRHSSEETPFPVPVSRCRPLLGGYMFSPQVASGLSCSIVVGRWLLLHSCPSSSPSLRSCRPASPCRQGGLAWPPPMGDGDGRGETHLWKQEGGQGNQGAPYPQPLRRPTSHPHTLSPLCQDAWSRCLSFSHTPHTPRLENSQDRDHCFPRSQRGLPTSPKSQFTSPEDAVRPRAEPRKEGFRLR